MADPIAVGELTDVPAPLSPVNAQFHQEVAHRIAHRFASVAAMNAWAAGNGALAFVNPTLYLRQGGTWVALAPQAAVNTADTNLQNAISAGDSNLQGQINSVNANLSTYPLGMIQRAFAGFLTLNTGTQVMCSVSWVADPGRWYRLVADVPRIDAQTAGQFVTIVIEEATTGNNYRMAIHTFTNAGDRSPIHTHLVISGLSGGQTWRMAGNTGSGTAVVPSGTYNSSNAMLTVEDMGAV